MPGVNITTAVRTGPAGTNDEVASQVFMVGETERGSTDGPILLRSFSEYTTYYGNYKSNSLYAHVKTFFDEGGSRCYVQRVVGDNATAGSIVLQNSGASATVLTLTATSVGAWSNNLTVQVLPGDTNIFDSLGAPVSSIRIQMKLDDVLVLSTRDFVNVTEAANFINSSAVSAFVEATANELSPVALPDVLAQPSTFSGGTDDPAGVSDSALVAALENFSPTLKSGAVCIPGRSGPTIWNGLRDHAAANNRIALLSFFDPSPAPNFTETPSAATARSDASVYYNDQYASNMAFYWPNIKVPAPSITELVYGATPGSGTTITISPESYVAAARARAIFEAGGPWRAGAGQISAANTIVGLTQDVTAATGETMDAARVNVIRNIANSVRVYGARSVSGDEANWRYITMRDTMNYISVGIEDRMEEYVFETIDGRGNLFGLIRASIKAFLDPIRVAGGLYEAYDDQGTLVDPGYNVVVDSSNNPVTQLATGLVKAEVGVRVSAVADLISIVITKSNLSAPVI